MTASPWLQVALVAVAVLLAVLGLTILLTRLIRNAVQHRRRARHEPLRRLVLELLSEDDLDLSALDDRAKRDVALVEDIVWGLLTKVRGSSREALASWLLSTGAVDRACRQTRSRSAVRRAIAAERLGAAGLPSATQHVARLLGDRHADVRIVAARALGKLGDPGAVPTLLSTLDSPRSVPFGIVAMALIHIGPGSVELFVQALTSRSQAARAMAAELLGMHGAIRAVRHLAELAQHDASVEVRVRAVTALGRIGSPAPVDALGRLLSPAGPAAVRAASARSLGLIGGAQVVASLQTALEDDDGGVRQAAAEGLAAAGAQGAGVLEFAAASAGRGSVAASAELFRRQLLEEQRAGTRRRRPAAHLHA